MRDKTKARGRANHGQNNNAGACVCPTYNYTPNAQHGKSVLWRGVLRVCVAVTAAADRVAGYALQRAIVAEATQSTYLEAAHD